MPTFETVASFDHGQTLGATAPRWTIPPILFVSPDGRYIASQGEGRKTNPVGGTTRIDRLVRIWDSRRNKEIARFRPLTPMLIAFAPSGGKMLTLSGKMASDKASELKIALELWDLSETMPPFEEQREIRSVKLEAPISGQSERQRSPKNGDRCHEGELALERSCLGGRRLQAPGARSGQQRDTGH